MHVIFYFLMPFVLALAFTPFIKWLSVKLQIYAIANERTVHTGKIGRIGGVAIYIAFLLSMTFFTRESGLDSMFQAVFYAGGVIFICGLCDDMIDLKPIYKVLAQIVAGVILVFFGNISLDVIHLPLGIVVDTGVVSTIVTFIWIIGITNAINLIDGLDGLAGGVSVIVLLTIACVSIVDQRPDIMLLSLVLAGAASGFLVFNFHPAKIFMGDCGALFLGVTISAISLMGFKGSTFITLGFPILLLIVPIVDTFSAIIRRKLSGKSFSEADKKHMHHNLMGKFSHRNTVLIIYLITILFGASAFIYMLNAVAGLTLITLLLIGLELFIEKTGMISERYRPILWVIDNIRKSKSKK